MGVKKPTIGVVAGSAEIATLIGRAVERSGGHVRAVSSTDDLMAGKSIAGIQALVTSDASGVPVLEAALTADIPVLCTGDGLHALNLAMGGSLVDELPGHDVDDPSEAAFHRIFIAPGSKLAATVGAGGFVRVNSRHRGGVTEARKATSLMASAYSLEDGVIEALESPHHRWVVGVQFEPERRAEIPPHFDKLFVALTEHAAEGMNTTK